MVDHVTKTEEEWRNQLTPEQYEVCRRKGTEIPFSRKYANSKEKGTYRCTCCGAELFSSDHKFDSGTGWPSFTQPIKDENVHDDIDLSHGMQRVEVTCSRCAAHLGHVFDDGPNPTGKRYCINSISLNMDEKS